MRKRKGLNVVILKGCEFSGIETVAQLYDTLIYKESNGYITLNSGGWRTKHTKNCINDLLPDGFKLYQRDFNWYVVTPYSELPFTDNMVLELNKYKEVI